jgi:flagellar motor component MotA
MSETIIVGIISLVGTFCGVLTSNKLTNFRIEKLEKKMETQNDILERIYKLEGQVIEIQHNVQDLKLTIATKGKTT